MIIQLKVGLMLYLAFYTVSSSCQYTCENCTNSTRCQACNISKQRKFDASNTFCICSTSYYDDGINQQCEECPYSCVRCTNDSKCQTCNGSNHRHNPSQSCPCIDGYFNMDKVAQCQLCNYTCKTCSNSSKCLSCQSDYNRFKNGDSCDCKDGFFHIPNIQQCGICDYSCLKCVDNNAKCTSCNGTAYRQKSGTICQCKQQYYDNQQEQCSRCNYTCLTCTTVNICETCNANKFRIKSISTGLCKCMDTYYDDTLDNELCLKCNLTCATCADGISCATCDSSRFRKMNSTAQFVSTSNPFCGCFNKYYSLGDSKNCQKCHESCKQCFESGDTGCLNCNGTAHRTLKNKNCICDDAYYDDNLTQECKPCNVACSVCYAGDVSSCTKCNSTNYFLSTNNTCYTQCPDYYFDSNPLKLCKLCSQYCLKCINASNCTQCQSNKYRYMNGCFTECPYKTYEVNKTKVCKDCQSVCTICTQPLKCSQCIANYFVDSTYNYCFPCSARCYRCDNSVDQCTNCTSPYYLNGIKCELLLCNDGEYTDPILGCQPCKAKFQNARTCNFTHIIQCLYDYKMNDSLCSACSNFPGYFVNSTEYCTQICGDGLKFDLACDDKNILDGDGCSHKCAIQTGWSCQNTSCNLLSKIDLSLKNLYKYPTQNKILFYIQFQLPIRLQTQLFQIIIENINKNDYNWQITQTNNNFKELLILLEYQTTIHNKKINIQYNKNTTSTRLLTNSQHRILLSIDFELSFLVSPYPPAIYYQSSKLQFYMKMQYFIMITSLVLLGISLIIIPKRMALHSISLATIPAQIYIIFGLGTQSITEWVQYTFQQLRYSALIGGISFGSCCTKSGNFTEYSSELSLTCGFVLIALITLWITLGGIYLMNSLCFNLRFQLLIVSYYVMTLHIILFVHLLYAAINALVHPIFNTTIDLYNTFLALFLTISAVGILIFSWGHTYQLRLNDTISRVMDESEFIGSQIKSNSELSFKQNSQNEKQDRRDKQKKQKNKLNIGKENSQENQEEQNIIIQSQFFSFDYIFLYKQNNKIAKYYLPITITKIFLSVSIALILRENHMFLFIILSAFEGSYAFYMIIVRPFKSIFTNFRIIIISMILLTLHLIMLMQVIQSLNNTYYQIFEFIIVLLVLGILALCIIFCLIEHIMSLRLKIVHKNPVYNSQSEQNNNKFEVQEDNNSYQNGDSIVVEDAFYARILKRQIDRKKNIRRRRKI